MQAASVIYIQTDILVTFVFFLCSLRQFHISVLNSFWQKRTVAVQSVRYWIQQYRGTFDRTVTCLPLSHTFACQSCISSCTALIDPYAFSINWRILCSSKISGNWIATSINWSTDRLFSSFRVSYTSPGSCNIIQGMRCAPRNSIIP